ncbi:hypothetical protein ACQ4LE_004357 [Meloidogyne hapla]
MFCSSKTSLLFNFINIDSLLFVLVPGSGRTTFSSKTCVGVTGFCICCVLTTFSTFSTTSELICCFCCSFVCCSELFLFKFFVCCFSSPTLFISLFLLHVKGKEGKGQKEEVCRRKTLSRK